MQRSHRTGLTRRSLIAGLAASSLALAGCELSLGAPDLGSMAGFEPGEEVTVSGEIAWRQDEELILATPGGRPQPVYVGPRRLPFGPGDAVTVRGIADRGGGRGLVFAIEITGPGGETVRLG